MADDDTMLAEANEIDEDVKFAPDAVPFISQVPGFRSRRGAESHDRKGEGKGP